MGPEDILFEVELEGFEPHSLRGGKGRKFAVKKSLREAIQHKAGTALLDESRLRLEGRLAKVDVIFRLWEGSPEITDTRAKKDLDNLLKVVLDVLQTALDAKNMEPGLGLVKKDGYVCDLHAKKELVRRCEEEGLCITIREHHDQRMLELLQKEGRKEVDSGQR